MTGANDFIRTSSKTMIKDGFFYPEADILETLPDGRLIQLAARGVPIPELEARKLGFIKLPVQMPTETKTNGDDDDDDVSAPVNASTSAEPKKKRKKSE